MDSYVSNSLNQYASINGAASSHDRNGNLIQSAAVANGLTFGYDAENTLNSTDGPGGSNDFNFGTYADRMVGYEYWTLFSQYKTFYHYDGDQLIAEYNGAYPFPGDGKTGLLRKFVRGPLLFVRPRRLRACGRPGPERRMISAMIMRIRRPRSWRARRSMIWRWSMRRPRRRRILTSPTRLTSTQFFLRAF
ncbi:MAG: hypothetical protein Tsb0010_17660 [Parvularculaceae bacterium]